MTCQQWSEDVHILTSMHDPPALQLPKYKLKWYEAKYHTGLLVCTQRVKDLWTVIW